MDDRSKVLLRELIELHVASGQPVASRALSRYCSLALSPATIRHVMADLESEGFVSSLHTSSGRVPTHRGYRFFIDMLLFFSSKNPSQAVPSDIESYLNFDSTEQLMQSTAHFLSRASFFVGIVQVPQKRVDEIRHIEFLKLSPRRLLMILVAADGAVENRLLHIDHDYSDAQLMEVTNFINQYYVGQSIEAAQRHLYCELLNIQTDIRDLFDKTVEFSQSFLRKNNQRYLVEGKRNLLSIDDFSKNIDRLKGLFDLFEQRSLLCDILDSSLQGQGIRVFIGDELGIAPLSGCSVVLAPYHASSDRAVGTLGVIGPMRMNYDRVISLVGLASRSLSRILSKDVFCPL